MRDHSYSYIIIGLLLICILLQLYSTRSKSTEPYTVNVVDVTNTNPFNGKSFKRLEVTKNNDGSCEYVSRTISFLVINGVDNIKFVENSLDSNNNTREYVATHNINQNGDFKITYHDGISNTSISGSFTITGEYHSSQPQKFTYISDPTSTTTPVLHVTDPNGETVDYKMS